jgi:ribosomal protein S18 acetylase RimI-like enzyme
VITLDSSSPLGLVKESLLTNERGFDPKFVGMVTDADTVAYRRRLTSARVFLAKLAETPVGAGMFVEPFDGVTELSGITTLEPFRRRGVGAALTARAVVEAFSQGVDLVFLTTANGDARRVYEHLGFCTEATKLTYCEISPSSSA